MNTSKLVRIVFLTICFFIIFQVFTIGESVAATYYVAPNGSNSNTGSTNCSNAWLTFSYAQSQMSAGDTLNLCDGTYTTSDSGMLVVTVSGTSGNYITFQAVNEGGAIIDGNTVTAIAPFKADGKSWFKVIGLRFRESEGGNSVINVIGGSHDAIFQRVTAHDAEDGNNSHVWRIADGSYNILVEDCAGWGIGRNSLLIHGTTTHDITIRRFFAQLKQHDGTSGGMSCTQIYGASNTIIENLICTVHDNFSSPAYGQTNGIGIWDNNQNSTNNNTVYGSVVYDLNKVERKHISKDFGISSKKYQISGNSLINCVSIGSDNKYGHNEYALLPGYGDNNFNITNCTFTGGDEDTIEFSDPLSPITTNIKMKNTIVMGGDVCGFEQKGDVPNSFTHTYNTFYNNGIHFCDNSQHVTENNRNPNFDTATYGYGAYLMRPSALRGLGENGGDIGAEVLYRYKDGVLTNKPLWPWPMEDRIYKELGVSVTYEKKGGLWKTLENVYDSSRTQLPNSPTGLQIIEN